MNGPTSQIDPAAVARYESARDVVISLNPIAGSGPTKVRVDRLASLLRDHGFEPLVLTDLDEVARQTNERFAEGRLRALVGAGGDGTAAELVNRTVPGVPLTLLPSGGENLLARYLGLRRAPEAICQVIRTGGLRRYDAASASGRIFLLMISCGFDAEVVRLVHERRRGQITKLAWARPLWESVWGYRYPRIEVLREGASGTANGVEGPAQIAAMEVEPWEVGWLFGFNLPCYGAGFRIAPEADGRDGLLDLCCFKGRRLRSALNYVVQVRLGRHQRLADCHIGRAARFRIQADEPVPFQLDGDFGGYLPVEVEVLPQRLTVLVPQEGSD